MVLKVLEKLNILNIFFTIGLEFIEIGMYFFL